MFVNTISKKSLSSCLHPPWRKISLWCVWMWKIKTKNTLYCTNLQQESASTLLLRLFFFQRLRDPLCLWWLFAACRHLVNSFCWIYMHCTQKMVHLTSKTKMDTPRLASSAQKHDLFDYMNGILLHLASSAVAAEVERKLKIKECWEYKWNIMNYTREFFLFKLPLNRDDQL